jgi:hypothetical protein
LGASCDLALAGRDAIGRHEDQGSLIIGSMSLHHLRLWKCAGTKLTIEYAPLLKYLETGITPYVTGAATAGTHNVSIVVRELHAVALRLHALEIHGAKGPAFKWKKRESLHKLTILGIALNICLPEQAASLVELLSQFPVLLGDLLFCRLTTVVIIFIILYIYILSVVALPFNDFLNTIIYCFLLHTVCCCIAL